MTYVARWRGKFAAASNRTPEPEMTQDQLDAQAGAVENVITKFQLLEFAVHSVTMSQKKQPRYTCGDGAVLEFPTDTPVGFELVADPVEGLLLQVSRNTNYDLKKHQAEKESTSPLSGNETRHLGTSWQLSNYDVAEQKLDIVRTRTIQSAPSLRRIGTRVLARRACSHDEKEMRITPGELFADITKTTVELLGPEKGARLLNTMADLMNAADQMPDGATPTAKPAL